MVAFEPDRGISKAKLLLTSIQCMISRTGKNGQLFPALSDDSLSVFSTETVRSTALIAQCFCFSLLKNSDTRSQSLRREARLQCLFFGLRTIFVSQSDRRRKESKRPQVLTRSLDRRKQRKSHLINSGVHAYMSKIDQTQGRQPCDRPGAAPERPRL